MTGHILSEIQNPSFLTTLQATMTILDDISTQIDDNAYLTLANHLQQLYIIHTSYNPPITRPTSPTSTISSVSSVRNVLRVTDISGNINTNTNSNNNLNIINDININNFRDIPIIIPLPFRLDRN